MAVKENSEPDDLEWSTEEEVQLLYALDGLRPVGINKHFYMARICERMSNALKRDIAPEIIWAHLRTWYNLDALDQMERVPFAEEEVEFSLPESEFSTLMTKKLAEAEEKKPIDIKTETNTKVKASTPQSTSTKTRPQTPKELDKKVANKIMAEQPKRGQKRTRGSISNESNSSPSTTPPPTLANKRRRI
ncbi:MRG/MORF4L-binding protein isoform X2 [Contarinia nasturtii]|uniref:MRG/MORF4L-binding protein isoform X2 n=1 Tax=Contarinia nasturtii TaxID=265458 RepID=UPI0012D3EAA1|nr:MRG/MORF4L-binding protein isoform X2 [Contarinia nasturtii]